jgi:hypothetical protein
MTLKELIYVVANLCIIYSYVVCYLCTYYPLLT